VRKATPNWDEDDLMSLTADKSGNSRYSVDGKAFKWQLKRQQGGYKAATFSGLQPISSIEAGKTRKRQF
jgi:hypothetical protein